MVRNESSVRKFRAPLYLISFLVLFSIASTHSYSQNVSSNSRVSNVENNSTNENPVIPGDFADPSIIRNGDVYYATGTSSEWAPHFPLFQSTDMFHWKQLGFVFSQTPSWTSSSFWAPELFYRNGIYFLYYVARKKSDNISCIGVATAVDPAKGFTDRGILLEFGKEAIDPFVIEDNGQLYITWKAYGLDQRPIEILGSRLSDDGLKVEGESFMLLRDDKKEGLEGQCLVKRNNYYYLFYSGGACCGRGCSYNVKVARSATLQGPYTNTEKNPILSETPEWKCTGHGTLVTSREGNDFFMYHAYSKTADVYTGRQGMLSEVVWNKQTGWPDIQPLGHKAPQKKNFRDDFLSPRLSDDWQWDFRNTLPEVRMEKGNLLLSGQTNPGNETGTAITVRPLSGNYEMETEVLNNKASLSSLVLYGDAGQAVGIGVKENVLQVWQVKGKTRSVVKEELLNGNGPIQLKMTVEKGYECRFYYSRSKNGKVWNEMKTGNTYYKGDFLPPWDRSPRPGLLQKGTEAGTFRYFEIKYH